VLLTQLLRPRLEHIERRRATEPASEPPRFQPALLVVDGYDPAGPLDALPMLREALARGHELGILIICLVDAPDRVPAQIGARIELTGGWAAYTESGPNGRRERNVRAAGADVALCESLARRLAPLRLRGRRDEAERVESEGLLDLLELAGHDGHVLAAPIAIGDDGRPLVLDLKEAAEGGMGPHGLVVGATGSGKSELLRTLVAGLALEHDPEELAFVFVDYKGGATFAELEQLPHVAGTITNLERELTLVDRMREALLGELERRQRLLQEAGPFDRVRDYQRHRAANPELGLEPLPSLLVIVDEFGELLTSRPDFLDFFVSAGRTGRSLGIHLLLSTQKLDEGRIRGLEGHLRYRICLRTFSPEESLVALGTRHAYELPPLPGLAYLRVDGALRRFKAAHVSRPYREHRPLVEEASVVRAFGVRGAEQELAIVRPARIGAPGPVHEAGRTELQVAIARANAAAVGRPPVRRVWLPPLPDALSLEAVLDPDEAPRRPGTDGWLCVPVGLVDRPREQLQPGLELDFTGVGGHLAVVGAPRSGKSTLLQTLVAGLALTHDPGDVQVYAVDLGGGGLHALAGLPHVGAVYGRDDRDRIRRLVRELQGVVAERSAAFRRHGVDGMLAYHRAQETGAVERARYGEVFLVVDNWNVLVHENEELEPAIAELVATGLHYGVHVVVSANRWNDIRLAVRDNVGGRLELRLNDPLESEVDRHSAKLVADAVPGRGLMRGGELFQAALPSLTADLATGLRRGVEHVAATAAERWSARPAAPEIPLLPDLVTAADLPDADADSGPGFAIGLEEYGLQPARLDLLGVDTHVLVLGDAESGKTSLLRGLAQRVSAGATHDEVQVALFDYRRQLLDAVPETHLAGYACTPDAATELAERLAVQLRTRMPSPGSTPAELGLRRSWSGPELVAIVDDYDLVFSPTATPLQPLTELLAYGRDIGFHLVLARRVSGLVRSQFEPVVQRLRELGATGVVLSGDPQEGPVLADVKAVPQPPGRGLLVRNRRSVLVQTVHTPAAQTAPLTAEPVEVLR
jgi:S-DNA-T family DNA segregation ATPase FtsK/SpoIIIE